MQMHTYKGQELSISQLAKHQNAKAPRSVIDNRLRAGWEVDKAVETPVMTSSCAGRRGSHKWRHSFNFRSNQK